MTDDVHVREIGSAGRGYYVPRDIADEMTKANPGKFEIYEPAPNAETIAAMEDCEAGRFTRFKSVDAMFKALGLNGGDDDRA